MKAADIPDDTLLGIVREFNEGRVPDKTGFFGTISGPRWCQMWDLTERLPGIPYKVIHAKARRLIKRGLLDGCPCGCRGDFVVPGTPAWTPPYDPLSEAIRRA